jgi:hypothetical protein
VALFCTAWIWAMMPTFWRLCWNFRSRGIYLRKIMLPHPQPVGTQWQNHQLVTFTVYLWVLRSVVVKALGYKPEGRGFETYWGDILNLHSPSGRTRPWGSLSL